MQDFCEEGKRRGSATRGGRLAPGARDRIGSGLPWHDAHARDLRGLDLLSRGVSRALGSVELGTGVRARRGRAHRSSADPRGPRAPGRTSRRCPGLHETMDARGWGKARCSRVTSAEPIDAPPFIQRRRAGGHRASRHTPRWRPSRHRRSQRRTRRGRPSRRRRSWIPQETTSPARTPRHVRP